MVIAEKLREASNLAGGAIKHPGLGRGNDESGCQFCFAGEAAMKRSAAKGSSFVIRLSVSLIFALAVPSALDV